MRLLKWLLNRRTTSELPDPHPGRREVLYLDGPLAGHVLHLPDSCHAHSVAVPGPELEGPEIEVRYVVDHQRPQAYATLDHVRFFV